MALFLAAARVDFLAPGLTFPRLATVFLTADFFGRLADFFAARAGALRRFCVAGLRVAGAWGAASADSSRRVISSTSPSARIVRSRSCLA